MVVVLVVEVEEVLQHQYNVAVMLSSSCVAGGGASQERRRRGIGSRRFRSRRLVSRVRQGVPRTISQAGPHTPPPQPHGGKALRLPALPAPHDHETQPAHPHPRRT